MHRFDYSFLANGLLPAKLLDVTANIYSLRTAANQKKGDNEKAFLALESVAKVQSVKSSNAIEGIVTSDSRIEAIVRHGSAPLNHDEAEIAGYRDALNQVHTDFKRLSFGESDIVFLHEIMMTLSGDELAGQYKQSDNVILEIDEMGNRKVRFRPVAASETKFAMEQLELAYLDASSNSNINQLLLIPCVILDFLCIHPFRDGNGRISRLLTLLLLYKNGFDAGKYISFEEQINKYKDNYYNALQQSSLGWDTIQNDYFPFMQNFLQMLHLCYYELDKRFNVVSGKKFNKDARIEVAVLGSLKPISKAEICKMYPDISQTTVEAVLGRMVKNGQIEKVGASRSTRYIRKNRS